MNDMNKMLWKNGKNTMMNTKDQDYQKVYDRLCKYCPFAKKCHDECEECDEFTHALELESLHNKKRRYKELTHQEKCEIYNLCQSGQYTYKELCDRFKITYLTLRKAINEIKYFLRTGKPYDM